MIIPQSIPEQGLYKTVIVSARMGPIAITEYGSRNTIEFDHKIIPTGVILTQRCIAVISSNSKLSNIFRSVIGEVPKPVDTDFLINRECVVEVKHNISKRNGAVFANITNTYSASEIDESKIIVPKVNHKISEAAERLFDDEEEV